MNKQQLRKYFLMTDESMAKIRALNDAEKRFSVLDHKLKKVLYDNKLSAYNKYFLYWQLFNKMQQFRQNFHKKYNQQATPNATSSTQTSVLNNVISTQTNDSLNNSSINVSNIPSTSTPTNTSQSSNERTSSINELQVNPLMQYRDQSMVTDESLFEPASTSNENPVIRQLNYTLPNLDALNIADGQTKTTYDPKFLTTIDWDEVNDFGNIEPQTPAQQRRFSAAAMASGAKKKTNKTQPVYTEDDGALGLEDQNDPNLTVVYTPEHHRKLNYVTIPINGVEYSVPVDQKDDFSEFAAEMLARNANVEKLTDEDFQAFKNRKDAEFAKMLAEEKQLKERVQQREEQASLAQELEAAANVKNSKRKINNWEAIHSAAAASSTPKPKKQKKTPNKVDTNQPSVSEMFKKTKNVSTSVNNKQAGAGKKKMKKLRWVELK